MKKALLLVLSFAFIGLLMAQPKSHWTLHPSKNGIATDKGVARLSFPTQFKLFSLNLAGLHDELFRVVDNRQAHTAIISLPNAEGQMEQFEVVEASNFETALQARFPEIRAFSGKGLTDKYATLKLSISPEGIQTMVFRVGQPSEFIEPYSADHTIYAVFYKQRPATPLPWKCLTPDEQLSESLQTQVAQSGLSARSGGDLKTMRLAQSCNAEYSNYFGATSATQVNLVLAAFNNTLTRCNGIYEKDLALHLNLVDSSRKVIYYNATTDPYTTMANWNSQLQTTLNTQVGAANYDIGHMFGSSGGGGNAGCIGCVCVDASKGSGITSPADGIPQGDNFDIDYVAHEVGHQLGGNHTFSMSLEGTGVNKEVGSGITIMGYAGITDQDVTNHSIDIFHQASIAQIQANLATKTCPVTTSITANNATPVVAAVSNYTIPISTPFALTGSATDANGDALTYCWEQNDNSTVSGASSVASATKASGPNWISFLPTASPVRYFPKLATILAGGTVSGPLTGGDAGANTEALSSVARTLNFRLTVRDNAIYSSTAPVKVGQTQFTDMVVTVSAVSGPFAVTAPNTAVTWAGGSTQTVTWSVANTTATPVSCANVKISLSTDGGQTFPTVLVASTPNDGSEAIVVPNSPSTTARIKVEAVGNIFFDIDNANFTITASSTPVTPIFDAIAPICAGATAPVLPSTSANGITGTWAPLTVSNQQSATYTFTPDPGQNANTATISVTVNALPLVAVNSASVCSGGSVTLTASGANTYNWQPSTGLTTMTGATVIAFPSVTTNYTVTGTNTSTGCSNTATAVVTVNPNPTVTANDAAVCVGSSVTLTASGASTYAWTPSSGLSAVVGATVTASPTATTIYVVTGTSSAGCTGRDSVTVTVSALPAAPSAVNNSRCGSGVVVLTATTALGNVIDWYAASSGGTALLSGSNSFTTPSISVTTIYYAQARNLTTGCLSGTRTPVTASVTNNTSFNPFADTIKVCGTSYVLNAGTGFDSYLWSNAATTSSIVVTSTGKYKCTVTQGACTASDSSFVSIVTANILNNDTSLCSGTSITLNATVNNQAPNLTWSTGATGATITVTPTTTTTYFLSVTNGYNTCIDSVKITIGGATIPGTPGTITGATDVCTSFAGDTSLLSQPVLYRIARLSTATSYLWTLPAGASFAGPSTDTAILVRFASTFVSGAITVKAVNACGSSATARSLTVYKRVAATPGTIQKSFVPSVAAVSNVCGLIKETYVIRKVAYATSYNWTLKVGTYATITHLNPLGVNDTAVSVSFLAGFTRDTLSVNSVTACSMSAARTTIMSSVFAPPTPTAISGSVTPCVGNSITYTVTSPTPTATQGVASVFRWTKPNNTTITAATADSSSITLQYNTGFTGGSITVKAQTACGIQGSAKSISLLVNPPTPSVITASTGNFTPCIGDAVQYTASAPAPSTSQTAIAVFRWTKPANTSIIAANTDSSTITLQFNTGFTGGSISIKGQTACGVQGSAKSVTFIYLPPTPSSITSSTGSYNACVGNVINYTAVVPAPTATQRAAVVYRWSLPPNTTIVGASSDSLTVSLRYDAGYVGGMLVVRGQTACGAQGSAKNQLMTHTGCPAGTRFAKTAIDETPATLTVYPNPTHDYFMVMNTSKSAMKVNIHDLQGRFIQSVQVQAGNSMKLGNDLKTGVYMVSYTLNGTSRQTKLIKQ